MSTAAATTTVTNAKIAFTQAQSKGSLIEFINLQPTKMLKTHTSGCADNAGITDLKAKGIQNKGSLGWCW